jgi:hypothetical protein
MWGVGVCSVLNEGVKDFVEKDGMVVIQIAAGCIFVVDVKSFDFIYMCPFFLIM